MGIHLIAQKFYVLSIKGTVYVDNKPLKKKDKVSMGTKLRFKNSADEIRLISSSGRYKLKGERAERISSNELIMELRNEIFAPTPYAHTSVSTIAIAEESKMEINAYSTLISPQTTIAVSGEETFYIQYTAQDSLYEIPLKKIDGRVQITRQTIPETDADSMVYSIISKLENDSIKLHFRLSQPNWIAKEAIIAELKQIAKDSSNMSKYGLLKIAKKVFYGKKQMIPEEALENLIAEEIHWYDYKPYSQKTTFINPSQFYLENESNYYPKEEGEMKLVHLFADNQIVTEIKQKKGAYFLNKKSFKLKGKQKPKRGDKVIRIALVYQPNNSTHLKDAIPIHDFQLTTFIPIKKIKKELKFLRKEVGITDKKELFAILKESLDEEHGAYTYVEQTLKNIIIE